MALPLGELARERLRGRSKANGCCPSSGAARHLPPAGEGFSGSDKVSGSTQRLPLGGAVAQRLRGFKWRSEKSVKAIAPTGAALAFLCFDFFFRFVKGEEPLETGCGTQHPLRALGGTRVLLAAAPTTPPCFRRWRRSSSLLLRGGWSPEVGRGESEHPSLPLAQRSVPARLRQAKTFPAERRAFQIVPLPVVSTTKSAASSTPYCAK